MWVGELAPVIGLVALLAAFAFVFGQRADGLFSGFAPDGSATDASDAWQQAAYDGWWASTTHPAGFVAYVVVASIAIYYATLQNVVGIAFVHFFIARRRDLLYTADRLNIDGHYGWKELNRLLSTVLCSLFVNAVALALLALALRGSAFGVVGLLMAWTAILGPVYLFAPVVLLRRPIGRYRELQLSEVAARHTAGLIDDNIARTEAEAMRGITPFPVSRRMVAALFLYLLPVLVALVEVLGLFKS